MCDCRIEFKEENPEKDAAYIVQCKPCKAAPKLLEAGRRVVSELLRYECSAEARHQLQAAIAEAESK
jgi:hypothetical protein